MNEQCRVRPVATRRVAVLLGAFDPPTKAHLQLVRAADHVVREEIRVKSITSQRLDSDVAYIRLKQFQEGTHRELLEAARALRRGEADDAEPQRLAVQRAAQHQGVMSELLGDVVGDPLVGGGGGGQHRDAVGQLGQQGADPAVVRPEVMAPVGDAVGLVDDQQAAGRREPRHHLVADEVRLVLPDLHSLESWGDAEPLRGTVSLQQPAMDPVFAGTRACADESVDDVVSGTRRSIA